MAALAHRDGQAQEGLGQSASSRARRAPVRRTRAVARREANWNVLAQELIPFPPAAEGARNHRGERSALRPEPFRTSPVLPTSPTSPRAGRDPVRTHQAPVPRRALSLAADGTCAARAENHATSAKARRVAAQSRGLRRLLPGAATLAVLASVWFGAGALSTVHRPAMAVPAAAVRVHGGYLYVARPGDTLWSIASALQPGGDPRPIVAELEQQLHGAQLVAGDRLTLP